jgi:hypothetical protein
MDDILSGWCLPHPVEACVERLCHKGCQAVWDDIDRLERGEALPELTGLDGGQREAVLAELKSVMAVYGDRCQMPGTEQVPASPGVGAREDSPR